MNTTNLVIALMLLIALQLTGCGSREASIFEIYEDTQVGDLTEGTNANSNPGVTA